MDECKFCRGGEMSAGRFIIVDRYCRADARSNPNALYVFGDNMIGRGFGGQAGQMRGEPNAVGIPTKWHPNQDNRSYFCDGDLQNGDVKHAILGAIQKLEKHILEGGDVIYPRDGVGTGLSELPQRAPEILEFINKHIERLKELSS